VRRRRRRLHVHGQRRRRVARREMRCDAMRCDASEGRAVTETTKMPAFFPDRRRTGAERLRRKRSTACV
jgi:hypothetical protein